MILVFGKSGQIGLELGSFKNVVCLDRSDADLLNPKKCAEVIKNFSPEAVINAAAYTNVDKAEGDEVNASIINGLAPTAMARECAKLNIPIVHISTDYVFSGKGNIAWKTDDITMPLNAYGRSKLSGERGVCSSGSSYVILRTSWVISAHGNNFVKTMLSLKKDKKEIKIVSDQIGGPTPAKSIAIACLDIVKHLLKDPNKSGIYHYSGKPETTWAELGNEVFSQSGIDIKVKPISSQEYPTLAQRPLNSRLDCSKTKDVFKINQPDWNIDLKCILNDLGEQT